MVDQLRGLRERHGWDVCAVVSGATGKLNEKLRAEGIRCVPMDLSFTGVSDLLELPRKIIALERFLHSERFDVVQTHLFNSMIIGRFASWLADVPARLAMIAGPFHLEAYTPRWVDRATCWMDTAIIASCEYTRELYLAMGVPPRRLQVVYYGPDAARFDPASCEPAAVRREYGWAGDTPLIVMVAYFYPEFVQSRWIPRPMWGEATKGHKYLIRAMPTVLAEIPAARCLLVGAGWEGAGELHMEKMRQLVRELGLEGSVVFTGFRSDVNEMLRAADVAVQPSLTENLGGTIESLLMECPTVATRIGGMPDSVRDGETGILVEPRDPVDLARGILEMLNDRERARRLAMRGRALMLERFTLDRTVEDLAALYAVAAASRRGYRFVPRLLRRLLVLPVAAFLALRLVLVDLWLLPLWDAGWRPWRLRSWNRVALRVWGRLRGVVLRLWCWAWRVGALARGHARSAAQRTWCWAWRVGARIKRAVGRYAG